MQALELGHKMLNSTQIPRLFPELVHDVTLFLSKYAERVEAILNFIKKSTYVEGEGSLAVTIGGDLEFKNQVGLAAGSSSSVNKFRG